MENTDNTKTVKGSAILSVWLTDQQRNSGYYLQEDDHTVVLKNGNSVLMSWNALVVTKEQIKEDLARFFQGNSPKPK